MSEVDAAPPALDVDVVVDDGRWRSALPDAEALSARALDAAASAVPGLAGQNCEVSLLLTNDARVRGLNAEYRNRDSATNVLSFPALEDQERDRLAAGRALGPDPLPGPRPLGDIAVAFETTDREAHAEAKPLGHHLSHLVVHGFLHLVGYDHESNDEAEAMEALERRILAQLDIPDPYSV